MLGNKRVHSNSVAIDRFAVQQPPFILRGRVAGAEQPSHCTLHTGQSSTQQPCAAAASSAALLATSCSALAPPTKRRLNFINLTNGIEALPALDHSTQVCRIQSSRCEANDFYGVLQDLDHNLLFHLATGAECRIYDDGSRGTRWPGEVEQKIPRAIWWGLVWVRYALEDVEDPSCRYTDLTRL